MVYYVRIVYKESRSLIALLYWVILQAVIALLMIIPADFDTLVNYLSFTAWTFYAATMVSLLVLRYKRPDVHRPIKVKVTNDVRAIAMTSYKSVQLHSLPYVAWLKSDNKTVNTWRQRFSASDWLDWSPVFIHKDKRQTLVLQTQRFR